MYKRNIMKTLIRKSVFETNSSSTHSLTLKKVNASENTIQENASFEIRSALAKMVCFWGLLYHAESEYQTSIEFLLNNKTISQLQQEFYNHIASVVAKINPKFEPQHCKHHAFEFLDKLLSMYDKEYDETKAQFQALYLNHYRSQMQELKQYLLVNYCKMFHISEEQALQQINNETQRDIQLEKLLSSPETFPKAVEWLSYNSGFKESYETSTNKEEFAKQFAQNLYEKRCKQCNQEYCCHHYFEEGPMMDCDCELDNYELMYDEFKKFISHEGSQEFLSDSYAIVAKEHINFQDINKSNKIY